MGLLSIYGNQAGNHCLGLRDWRGLELRVDCAVGAYDGGLGFRV